ncbi:hypothetical protein [Paenibacillus sabinae]|uniref:Uncharacterized protein n=1 Tax=Paenibacillus sabinae T27 TaxID=1268072 RepID=X4ZG81_9BACL|nr:hypothetical protein [Paenibacillus sabinae]AHV96407.1 hypothetical protein PSAB_07375 [Paenibacillus sabinae T27]
MTMDHKDHKQVTITTGPVYVAPFNAPSSSAINDKLVVTLKNPTHKKLQAQVTLSLCPSPNPPVVVAGGTCTGNSVQTFEVNETDIHLGTFKVDPMTCLRIEKTFDNDQLFDTVIRLTATGDFKICEDSCEPICGLLEISSVVGSSGTGDGGVQSALPAEKTAFFQGYGGAPGVVLTDPQASIELV